ncbi:MULTISPECIES: keywimysin-related RiPP [Streptomyces]|nr:MULTISPECIES: keywimysin-related RiPP [Streptomyces]MCX4507900.1 keywimysin-related RiPP [Streptomyces anulatus]WTE26927.1 keywimysin-related RiPP [Streptomyces anulatus]
MKKAFYETPEFTAAGSFRSKTGLVVTIHADWNAPGWF